MRAYPDIDFRIYPYGPIYMGDVTYLGHIPTQTKLVQWTAGAPISTLYSVANLVNAQWLGGRKDVLNFLPELIHEVFMYPEYVPLNFNRADFSILGQALAARDGVGRGDTDPETGEYTEKAIKAEPSKAKPSKVPLKAPVSDGEAS